MDDLEAAFLRDGAHLRETAAQRCFVGQVPIGDQPQLAAGFQRTGGDCDEAPADVGASDIAFDRFGETRFKLTTPTGDAAVHLPLDGRHNISNALAAAAVGQSFGMTADEIASALSNVAVPPQRGEVLRFRLGFTVINDSYNSNPDALLSMVETLVEGSHGARRRIVVAGEMLELGTVAVGIAFRERIGERLAAGSIRAQ